MKISDVSPSHCQGTASAVTAPASRTVDVGTVHYLGEVFPNKEQPEYVRGAMKGEGVTAACGEDKKYLYSLGAQNGVIVTLYNDENKKGAVIHVDHNISAHIDDAIKETINKIGGSYNGGTESVRVSMIGGVWLTSDVNIGKPVQAALKQHGISPAWDFWSYSTCHQNNYGAVLNLETGVTSVFKPSSGVEDNFYAPLVAEVARKRQNRLPLLPEEERAKAFIKRSRGQELIEVSGHISFSGKKQLAVTEQDVKQRRILVHDLDAVRMPPQSNEVVGRPRLPQFNQIVRSQTESSLASSLSFMSEDGNEQVTKSSALDSVRFTVCGERKNIRMYIKEVNKLQGCLVDESFSAVKQRLEGLRQGLKLDNMDLTIDEPSYNPSVVSRSTASRSARSFLSSSSHRVRNSEMLDRFLGSSSASSGSASSTGSSDRGGSISSSRKVKITESLTIVASTIFKEQMQEFSSDHHEAIKKAVEDINEGREDPHSVYVNKFRGQNEASEIYALFGNTKKLGSSDLTNWDKTGSGRGAWRLVGKRGHEGIKILGVYDTHTPYYKRWS